MKIVILNGSPRKGNVYAAINAFAAAAEKKNDVEIIDTDSVNVSPCKGCGACQCYKGCVAKDDSNMVVDKIVSADMIVFATPVYWWGMTAQLKTVIDKCYCKGAQLKGKKVGVIIVGGASVEDPQYELISTQFRSMAGYLSWELAFTKAYSATAKGELAADTAAMDELKALAGEF